MDIEDISGEQQELNLVVERLSGRFPETSPIEIAAIVREEHDKLAEGRIRNFIPVLVEHGARDRLRRNGEASTAIG